jgi:exonuclease SbcC
MQPNILTLTKFKGIRSGLNRESVTLSFYQYSDARLIAIAGPNGIGKSTILENLHPYRLMPSYASEPRPTSFSYWDHVEEGEASKVLEWTFAGKRYKSEFVFKSLANKKKADYYLLELDAFAGWKPFSREDVTSDGRSDTYDRAIELLLGPPEIFFNAIFCAQNRKQLTAHKEAEGAELIARLLSLDQLIEFGQKAAKVYKCLSFRRDQIEHQIHQVQDKIQASETTRAGLAEKKQAIEKLSEKLQQITDRIIAEKARETLAQHQGQELFALRAKSTELHKRLEAIRLYQEPTLQALAHSGSASLQAQAQILESSQVSLEQMLAGLQRNTQYRQEKSRLAARLAELQAAELDKQLIETLATEEAQYERYILETGNRLDQLQSDLKSTHKIVAERDEKVMLIKRELIALEASSSLIQSVPCAGTPMNQSCTLLDTARNEHSRLPAVKECLSAAMAAVNQLQSELERLKPIADNTRQLLSSARPVLSMQIQARLNVYKEVLQQGDSIRRAADSVPALDAEIEKIHCQIKIARDEIEVKRRVFADLQRQNQQAMDTLQQSLLQDLQKQLDENQAALQRLQPELDKTVLHSLQQSKIEAEAQWNHLSQSYMSDLAALPDHVSLAKECDLLRNGLGLLVKEMSCWHDLAKALSKTGIVNLCVEDAGPQIAELANKLLHESFGSRFTIRIDTLAADAKGVERECFRVQTLDTATGEVKPGTHNSGGQRIWINDALSKAVAIYLSRSTDRPYRTIFTDEADGALDVDHRRSWIRMKRAMLNTGGFSQEFFISHSPEVIEEADQVLDVAALELA